jgi:hypothetical protein
MQRYKKLRNPIKKDATFVEIKKDLEKSTAHFFGLDSGNQDNR